jgi:SSS family solute:Na+ symporter/sodium/proline symporter
LFSPATNLMHDVYERFINPQATERQSLIMSRVLVIALGLFALLQATQFQSILKAALYAYTVYGAAVTPAVLAVFFWKRTTTAGAISSIALGTVITVAWNIAQQGFGWKNDTDAVYPAVAASVVSLVLVSLLTPPPPEKKWRPFFE